MAEAAVAFAFAIAAAVVVLMIAVTTPGCNCSHSPAENEGGSRVNRGPRTFVLQRDTLFPQPRLP